MRITTSPRLVGREPKHVFSEKSTCSPAHAIHSMLSSTTLEPWPSHTPPSPQNSQFAEVARSSLETLASSWTGTVLVHILAVVEDGAGRRSRPRSIHLVPASSTFEMGFSVNEVPPRRGLHLRKRHRRQHRMLGRAFARS